MSGIVNGIASGRGWCFIERGPLVLAIFTEDPAEPCDELFAYGFGWADDLGAWVRLGGETGREVAKSIARSWTEADRVGGTGEPPDPSADIIATDAEDRAINAALDEAARRYECSETPLTLPTLADFIAANAHDDEAIEFFRDCVLPLAVGETYTYHGGAGGDTIYKRVE